MRRGKNLSKFTIITVGKTEHGRFFTFLSVSNQKHWFELVSVDKTENEEFFYLAFYFLKFTNWIHFKSKKQIIFRDQISQIFRLVKQNISSSSKLASENIFSSNLKILNQGFVPLVSKKELIFEVKFHGDLGR